MSKIVRLLGSIVFACLMYSVPVLAVWSLWHDWNYSVKIILVSFSFGQFLLLVSFVYSKVKEDGE